MTRYLLVLRVGFALHYHGVVAMFVGHGKDSKEET
jgi:hypothetical protein